MTRHCTTHTVQPNLILTLVLLYTGFFACQRPSKKKESLNLPEGYAIVGYRHGHSQNQQPILIGGPVHAEVTCICREGSDCHPFIVQDKQGISEGCVMTECTQCEKQIIVHTDTGTLTLTNATIFHLGGTTHFPDKTEAIARQPATPAMLQLDTVQTALQALPVFRALTWLPDTLRKQWIQQDPGLFWTQAVINLLGKWAVVTIPVGALNTPFLAVGSGGTNQNCQCSCQEGSGCTGACTCRWIPLVGRVCYCDAHGCEQCGLSAEILHEVRPGKTHLSVASATELQPDSLRLTIHITSDRSGRAVLAIAPADVYPPAQFLAMDTLTIQANQPVDHDISFSVPENGSSLFILISDGRGEIYGALTWNPATQTPDTTATTMLAPLIMLANSQNTE